MKIGILFCSYIPIAAAVGDSPSSLLATTVDDPSLQSSLDPSNSTVPSTQPSSRISSKTYKNPTVQPTQTSLSPSSRTALQSSVPPSPLHSFQPSSLPSNDPSGEPSSQPSLMPSNSPSNRPSFLPSDAPSIQPSSAPSWHPSESPSRQPTKSPSHQPTKRPSSQPTKRPSSQPTKRPSNQPTKRPSSQPTNRPSAQPTKKPSSKPTRRPTISPSSQPTHSLYGKFYPDWSGKNEGCLLNKKSNPAPDYMFRAKDPTSIFFDDLDSCCLRHYKYDLVGCMGSKAPSLSGKFYPDWTGKNEGCIINNEANPAPSYLLGSPGTFFDNLEECCKKNYSYKLDSCMGTAATGSNKWYLDWNILKCVQDCPRKNGDDCGGLANHGTFLYKNERQCCQGNTFVSCKDDTSLTPPTGSNLWYVDWKAKTCVKDCETGDDCGGFAPKYMLESKEQKWLYDDLDTCCDKHTAFNLANCASTVKPSFSGMYYPDWSGKNEGCVIDNESSPAPSYLVGTKGSFFDDLTKCCEINYSYKLASCLGTAATGSGKWYLDWSILRCVQDCRKKSDDDCGGLAEDGTTLYKNERKCCKENEFVSCKDETSLTPPTGSNKWYVDWKAKTCVKDCESGEDCGGFAPKYMSGGEEQTWLYDDLDACCEEHTSYKLASCASTVKPLLSGKFYPDWKGEGCLKDDESSPAPSYLIGTKGSFFDDLAGCCKTNFSHNYNSCMGTAVTTSNLWYIDWDILKCVQECEKGDDCGGLAEYGATLYKNKRKCCKEGLSFNYKECMN